MGDMSEVTVIILTHNEEIHIERCIRSIKSITDKIFIVDSFSIDRTVEIANSLGAIIVQRKWKNYADQFQWGLDHCKEYLGEETKWYMRMDADEYLTQELQQEILDVLPILSEKIDGIYLKRRQIFYGKWIRFGGLYPLKLLRIWRSGAGRIEQRWMDEHMVLARDSKTIVMKHDIADENLKGIGFWVHKHNSYATREAVDILNAKYYLFERDDTLLDLDDPQAKRKRILKNYLYIKLPLGYRSILYFIYRYIIRLGFLDGSKGIVYHLFQGLWYRMLVDLKVMEIEKKSQGDRLKMKLVLQNDYGIEI